MKTGVKVGMAIGIILGLALLGATVYLIIFLLKRRKQDMINAARLADLRAKAESASTGRGSDSPSFPTETAMVETDRPHLSERQIPTPTYSPVIQKQDNRGLAPPTATFDLPIQGQTITPTSPRRIPRAQKPPSPSRAVDLSDFDFPAVPRHQDYQASFSERVSPITPTTPPLRVITPAEELAAARLRSNVSTSSLSRNLNRSTESLKRNDSIVSAMSGPSTRGRDRGQLSPISRGNSVISARTEISRMTRYDP